MYRLLWETKRAGVGTIRRVRVLDVDRIEAPFGAGGQTPSQKRRANKAWLVPIGVAAAIVLGIVAVVRSGHAPKTMTPQQIAATVSTQVDKGIAAAKNVPPDARIAFATIQPSMVYIAAKQANSTDTASGAGVVVDASGKILTARHVIQGASSIEVTFSDGTKSSAAVDSQDAADDIAVLVPQTLPGTIVPAVLGGSVQIGDAVFAVGHPLGLVDSLTAGVVSGLGRTVPIAGGASLANLIQFDAAVNPGNSGGPLLNKAGQVVGVVTGLANPADQTFFVGIGFAVPISTAGGAAGAPQQ